MDHETLRKISFVFNFIAVVLVSLSVILSHDAIIRDKRRQEEVGAEVHELLDALRSSRLWTIVGLAFATAAFCVEGYTHVVREAA